MDEAYGTRNERARARCTRTPRTCARQAGVLLARVGEAEVRAIARCTSWFCSHRYSSTCSCLTLLRPDCRRSSCLAALSGHHKSTTSLGTPPHPLPSHHPNAERSPPPLCEPHLAPHPCPPTTPGANLSPHSLACHVVEALGGVPQAVSDLVAPVQRAAVREDDHVDGDQHGGQEPGGVPAAGKEGRKGVRVPRSPGPFIVFASYL